MVDGRKQNNVLFFYALSYIVYLKEKYRAAVSYNTKYQQKISK